MIYNLSQVNLDCERNEIWKYMGCNYGVKKKSWKKKNPSILLYKSYVDPLQVICRSLQYKYVGVYKFNGSINLFLELYVDTYM